MTEKGGDLTEKRNDGCRYGSETIFRMKIYLIYGNLWQTGAPRTPRTLWRTRKYLSDRQPDVDTPPLAVFWFQKQF